MLPVLDPGTARIALQNARLYAILDAAYAPPTRWPNLARQLAAGGAGVFQIRAKNLSKEEILTHTRILVPLLAELGLPLILNDYPDLVVPSGAAGCHLGQDDLGIPEARKRLGSSAILGLSTHSPCQALAGQAVGADYLGFGPIYATGTKPDYQPIGPGKFARSSAKLPSLSFASADSIPTAWPKPPATVPNASASCPTFSLPRIPPPPPGKSFPGLAPPRG